MNQQQERTIKELDELIDLAEKVSVNIEGIRNELIHIKNRLIFLSIFVVFFLGLAIIYYEMQDVKFHNEYNGVLIPFSLLCSLPFLLYIYIIRTAFTKKKRSIQGESLILENILDMIHSYKEVASQDMGIVKKAVVDMRLSRIKFNSNVEKKGEDSIKTATDFSEVLTTLRI